MKITFISDTHSKHNQIANDLPGGDLLIHSGDISSMGWEHEVKQFCKWFDKIDNYDCKVFIAGNHDLGFEDNYENIMQIVNSYKTINYLQDDYLIFNDVRIYGTPWQPEFFDWAFNLPRNGEALYQRWNNIPEDTDILVTHTPPFGHLDTVEGRRQENLGCELLRARVDVIKPQINCAGHLHSGYGIKSTRDTHFVNASVLDERYAYTQKPITINWNPENNTILNYE